MSRLDHPHVIKHIESFEDNRYYFIVMEALVDATDLSDVLEARKKDIESWTEEE